ncbi:MAG: hypothetical protein K2G33_08965 [Duncaniella sp.]|nr:hypothetical protein [Duncaniella sp.]
MNCLIETRNRHFMEACHRLILSLDPKEPINVAEVAAKAAEMPAPHYYCTFDYALRMLRVLRHGRLKLRNDRRLAQWREINEKVDVVMKRRGCRLIEALTHVLTFEPASRFFITPSTACGLLYKLMRG